MKLKYIDPPEGWRYGFPKLIHEDVEDTRAWLIANGYPAEKIEEYGDAFYVRYFGVDEE